MIAELTLAALLYTADKHPTPAESRTYVALRASRDGWQGRQWKCLDILVRNESGWRANAQSPTSSASGLFQLLKLPHGLTVAQQYERGRRYIRTRYRTPCRALEHWHEFGWY